MHNRGIELFVSNVVSVAHPLHKPSDVIIRLLLLNICNSVAGEHFKV